MTWDQVWILLTTVPAIFLSQTIEHRTRRWASVFGMAAQFAWFWATWHAEQWGEFIVTICITLAWAKGLWVYWIRYDDYADQVR